MATSLRPCSPTRLMPLLLALPLALACGSGDDDGSDGASSERMSEPTMTTEAVMPSPARPAATTPTNPVNEGPPAVSAPRAPAADSQSNGNQAAASQTPAAPPAPAAQGPAFAACTYSEGTYGRNCDSVFVTMKQTSPARCVQLTIDNCGDYGRQGIGGRLPMGWRVESGTVGSNPNECELGVFYPSSEVAQRAEGTISWNETTRLPSDLVLDVTLQTSVVGAELTTIDVATTAPIATSVCDR